MYYLILTDPQTAHVFSKKSECKEYLEKNFNKLGKPGADYKEAAGDSMNSVNEEFTLIFH